MQTITVAPAIHQTPGKLINNNNLVFLNHIIDIPLKKHMGFQSLVNMMQGFDLGRLIKIVNFQKLFDVSNS